MVLSNKFKINKNKTVILNYKNLKKIMIKGIAYKQKIFNN